MYPAANAITRARIEAFDDSGDVQRMRVKGYAGETFTEVARVQQHGLSSHPPVGAVGQVLRMGETDRLIGIGFDAPGRPRNLPAGGAVLYDAAGSVIYAKMSGGIEVKAAQGGVSIEAPSSANLTLTCGAMKILMSSTRIELGGSGGSRVMTEAGPSSKVYAVL